MTKKKNPEDLKKRGRKEVPFKPEYIEQIGKLCVLGMTDSEIAHFFDISERTFDKWKAKYPEMLRSLRIGKEVADERVKRSLYARAVGYNYEATKIFMPAGRCKPV
jgi:Homeodomain-like domain